MCETEAGSAQFAYARYCLLSRLLAAARAGTLDPGWRERLTVDVIHEREIGGGPEWVEFFEQVTGRSYVEEKAKDNDAEVLAVHEIVSDPVADWEPYVTNGDWRRALDAWYAAAIELRDYDEDAQLRHRKAIADRLRRTELEKLRSKLKAASDEFWADHYAKQLNKAEARLLKYVEPHSPSDELYSRILRDELAASYRAGLAAGGETNDWLGWYRTRAARWDIPGSAENSWYAWIKGQVDTRIRQLIMEPQRLTVAMEQLPTYWTEKQPPDGAPG
ncbi:hypothetical protein [Mycobacterium avium]|uniref:hypothetical protein n=1 Tax=Mycobacterium avium TaxID=1764 RepID=UPI0009FF439A|nr:hypothetical protein [Mycobacterium avium]